MIGAIKGTIKGTIRTIKEHSRSSDLKCNLEWAGGVYCSPRNRSKNPGHTKELIIANDFTGLDTTKYGEPRNQVLVTVSGDP